MRAVETSRTYRVVLHPGQVLTERLVHEQPCLIVHGACKGVQARLGVGNKTMLILRWCLSVLCAWMHRTLESR